MLTTAQLPKPMTKRILVAKFLRIFEFLPVSHIIIWTQIKLVGQCLTLILLQRTWIPS